MKAPQRHHWWQYWMQGAAVREAVGYRALQGMFHTWMDSLPPPDSRRLREVIGTNLPLRMQEGIQQLIEANVVEKGKVNLVHCLIVLCSMYIDDGQLTAAVRVGEKALAIRGRLDTRIMAVASSLATIYRKQGDRQKDLKMKQELVDFAKLHYGDQSLESLVALDNLSISHSPNGNISEAYKCSTEVLEVGSRLLGQTHPRTITVRSKRALLLLDMERLEEALPLAQMAREHLAQTPGVGHPESIISLDNLATIQRARGGKDLYLDLRLEAYTQAIVSLGNDHPTTRVIFAELKADFETRGDWKAMILLLRHKMWHYIEYHAEADPRGLESMNEVVLASIFDKDWQSAKETGERLVNLLRQTDARESTQYLLAIQKLMKAYDFLGDYKAAAELGEETISIYKKELGLDNEFAFSAIRDQSRIYLRLKEWQEAIRCSKIAVEISTKLSGEYSSKTTGVKQDLAITYQEAPNYETSLKVGLEVLKNLVLAFNMVNKAAVSEMLGACRFFSPRKAKSST
jgi:tetratricopeptide (TPR) repeat protein